MKIAVGLFYLECNTFNRDLVTKDQFTFAEGAEVHRYMHVKDYFDSIGVETWPTIMASTIPNGVLKEESYWYYANKLLASLETADHLDGILLHLHGSMEVENIGSGELVLLKKIRDFLGKEIPIGLVLDAHANNYAEICDYVNIIRGYHTIPHHDQPESEQEVACQLIELIKSKEKVIPQISLIPAVISGEKGLTEKYPLNLIMERVNEISRKDGIFSASVFMGEPWCDVPNSRMSVIVNPKTAADTQKARDYCDDLADLVFSYVPEFNFEVPALKPEKALKLALDQKEFPVFLADSGDNTTGGAIGEGTEILRLVLSSKERHSKRILITPIYDLKAFEYCKSQKIGTTVSLTVGTGRDVTSNPVAIKGILKSKGDLLGYLNCFDDVCGKCFTIQIDDKLDVQISNTATSFITAKHFDYAKTPLCNYDIIVLKQGYLFSQLRPYSKFALMAVSQGATYQYLEELDYKNLIHPIFPFDKVGADLIVKN
ncbi:M81 family metallopeptidase [Treponema parvum]|uniref:M81 family metallopeptidase n=1 Tax=Treponema parvum TaxID=138851 RepID=A0A975ICM0_9SPIR|nr:M81 family metallopeptidase [Treponema parvum]QTQ11937.1 M81 family metallopeptidase [Treponema parvum]